MDQIRCFLVEPVERFKHEGGSDWWRRVDTGEEGALWTFPVGAMWWAWWLDGSYFSKKHTARGGGPHLIVRTPGGDWDIDAPSSNGDGWDRTGIPPAVTARPSILFQSEDAKGTKIERYHGWLTNGILIKC